MSNANNTDDFFTYNTVPATVTVDCRCMYHHGEFAIVECTLDPAQTELNRSYSI